MNEISGFDEEPKICFIEVSYGYDIEFDDFIVRLFFNIIAFEHLS